MAFQIVTEPIDRWPLPDTKARKPTPFRASYTDTLDLLKRELEHLDARGPVVIQVVTRNGAADVRRDGALRAQAKIEHPGVRVSFESKHGPLTYGTDAFEARWYGQVDWQANLRAIALGLQALRAVDRYGISRTGEQYTGWKQLPAGAGVAPTGMTIEAALEVLRRETNMTADAESTAEALAGVLRYAKGRTHPDRNNGDRSRWDAVEQAEQVLRRPARL